LYPDVEKAAKWLCDTFGFTLPIGMGGHRAQLNVGNEGLRLTFTQSIADVAPESWGGVSGRL